MENGNPQLNSVMNTSGKTSALNSPSKIPAPKSRGSRSIFNGDSALAPLAAEPEIKPVNLSKNAPSMGTGKFSAGMKAQNSLAGANVRTYRANATGTTKPPVTKPVMTGNRNVRMANAIKNGANNNSNSGSIYNECLGEMEQLGKKRAHWDTRGRLEDMEQLTQMLQSKVLDSSESMSSLQEKLAESEARVRELESFRQNLSTTVSAKQQENEQIGGQLAEIKLKFETELASKEIEMGRAKAQLQFELETVQRQRDSIKAELESAQSQLSESRNDCANLRSTISRNASTLVDLESQITALKARIGKLEEDCTAKDAIAADLSARLEAAQALVLELEEKVQVGETQRRKLHNDVQELKGNIRVFCRVRPLMASEMSSPAARMEDELSHLALGGRTIEEQEQIQMIQSVESTTGMTGNSLKSFPFSFDRVFGPSATQEIVFDEISQLVQSALDGYRVCIFAYGQTGSGKTFTMEGAGSRGNPSQAGMIPRAVQQIFETSIKMREKGWTFAMEASYLEIYNESLRDLLVDGNNAGNNNAKYEIRHANGKTTVTDLLVMSVQSPEEVMSLLARAAHNRAVAETNCNERSSRSHSVFTLRITGENSITTEKVDGLLNLIDLAGSERLSQSGSTGDRLKETQAINKSLSSLGDVIYALANREQHVPFRNSKLTYLLQHSLGGNCKTLMFVNVSPAKHNFQETLCSLRFATKVNACQIGTARRAATK